MDIFQYYDAAFQANCHYSGDYGNDLDMECIYASPCFDLEQSGFQNPCRRLVCF